MIRKTIRLSPSQLQSVQRSLLTRLCIGPRWRWWWTWRRRRTTLPTALDSEHQKMLDELRSKSGKEFDSSYDQIQLKAHRDAVALFDAYAKVAIIRS